LLSICVDGAAWHQALSRVENDCRAGRFWSWPAHFHESPCRRKLNAGAQLNTIARPELGARVTAATIPALLSIGLVVLDSREVGAGGSSPEANP